MAAVLSLAQQLAALIARIKVQVPGLKSVVGMEDLDDAMETAELLPAAVVIFSGDYPEKKPGQGISEDSRQKVNRFWSVIVVMELTSGPGEALDLLEAINKAGKGWRPCQGMKLFVAAGKRFVTKFDKTRVVYEVRFSIETTE